MSMRAKDIYRQYRAGDDLLLKLKEKNIRGYLMPAHEFTSPGIVVLKLGGGYNVGISQDDILEVVPVTRNKWPKRLPEKQEVISSYECQRPRVTIITMGGTIASKVDYTTGAVKAVLNADELLEVNPALGELATIKCRAVCNILSENMLPRYMAQAAEAVAEEIRTGAHGVVITHGTDTMGYTAAMLSFMLEELPIPVVFVGSQRSSDRPSSDAYENLYDAVLVAASGRPGVMVTMHGSSSDDFSTIHRGVKVKKFHSSRRDAFRSVNCDPLGKVIGGVELIWSKRAEEFFVLQGTRDEPFALENYTARSALDDRAAMVYMHPGLRKRELAGLLSKVNAVVVAGTGLGHIAEELLPTLEGFIKKGGMAVMTTQCYHGAVNMNIYATGRTLQSIGVIPGGDMLPETALMKLMWVMGQTDDPGERRELMTSMLRGEFSQRRLMTS